MKGLIALDIDGTITTQGQPIPQEVVDYLYTLSRDRWLILFVTGRTFQWGYQVLKCMPFPYYLSVQNGAITLEMPSEQLLFKKYLEKSIIPVMQHICEEEPTDFVIYAGYEYADVCYYRPHQFDDPLRNYLKARTEKLRENWQEIASFDQFAMEQFPSVKCFGDYPSASRTAKQIEDLLGLHVPIIRDPFNEDFFVAQATHPQVNKGQVLFDLKQWLAHDGIVIAAGDDYNDQSMLSVANVKIVMATAPQEMLKEADVIAPPAKDKGIIAGLKQVIKRIEQRGIQ